MNKEYENACFEKRKTKIMPGYANVPISVMGKLYSPDAAMAAGTVFPELDLTIEEYERGLYDGK